MKRQFGPRPRQATVLLIIFMMTLVVPSSTLARSPGLSQETAVTQTAGTSTIAIGGDWVLDTTNTDPESVRLSHTLLPDTLYVFTDFADPGATNSAVVFTDFEQGFFSGFGDGDQQVVGSGAVAPSMMWQLYSVSQAGLPFGLLVTADIISSPGRVLMSILLAPTGTLGAATEAVQNSIDLNGTGSPLGGLAPVELDAALGSTSQPGQASAQLQPTASTLQEGGQPPLATTGSEVTVAGVAVRYGENWVYDDVNSVPDEHIYLDAAEGSLLRFFGFFVEEDPGIDAVSARDVFVQTYLTDIGVTAVQEIATGEGAFGTAWSANSAELSGQDILILFYIDVASTTGQIQISQLVTMPEDLPGALAEAQSSILIGDAAAFRDLDPAAVPGGSATAALPEIYLGTWEGTGTESDPTVTWPVSITFQVGGIDEVVGMASYPTLDCSSDFILKGIDPATDTAEMLEDITAGEANCVDGGTFVVTPDSTGQQLAFTWTSPDGTGSADGTLSPVQLSSQAVGGSTLSFSADWILDTDSTDDESVRLVHANLESSAYLYMEFPDATASGTTVVLEQFEAGFFDGFGDGNQQLVASGTVAPGTDWRLYTVTRNGVPFGVLGTADVTSQPGQVLSSVLLAPTNAMGTAVQAVLDTVVLNDTASPLVGIVPAELDATLAANGGANHGAWMTK